MNQQTQLSSAKSWSIVLVASLFFFFEFIQMNMFNAISRPLMSEFQLSAEEIGVISSYYFFANVVFLFVAGILFDRYSTRWVMALFFAVSILGTFWFAIAANIETMKFSRFLSGIGSAFCFIGVIRLASRWFDAKHLALVTGVVVTIAMLGGVFAQTPFSWLVTLLGWRHALIVDALLGIIFLIGIILIVRDYPLGKAHDNHLQELAQLNKESHLKAFRHAFLRLQNWLAAIYTSLMNLPLIVLGGLFGASYLHYVHELKGNQPTNVTSMLFWGMIVGSPIVGWFSDRLQQRRLPMIFGSCLALITILLLLLKTPFSYVSLMLFFFAIGFLASFQILSYPLVAETNPKWLTAMSVSVVSITTQGGLWIAEPLFGQLIDLHMKIRQHHLTLHYMSSDFSWAMLLFPVCIIVAIFAAFLILEEKKSKVSF